MPDNINLIHLIEIQNYTKKHFLTFYGSRLTPLSPRCAGSLFPFVLPHTDGVAGLRVIYSAIGKPDAATTALSSSLSTMPKTTVIAAEVHSNLALSLTLMLTRTST